MDTPSDARSLRNIVLGGFMGTGKSTAGRLTAQRMGWPFIDSDTWISVRAGRSIADIFRDEGEASFRDLEKQAAQALAALSHTVIATGGGMLANPENLAVFAEHGLVICLYAAPEVIEARVGRDSQRPLMLQDWRTLLERRRQAYAAIPHQIDTSHKTADQVAEEVVALWHRLST